jgi:hypothetical protein
VDFTGHWEEVSGAFSLDLAQNAETVLGRHAVIVRGGSKIDSMDQSIQGKLKGNTVEVVFQSSFATSTGTAQITFIDEKTIFWKMLTPPAGEYYLPQEATLIKQAAPATLSPAQTGTIVGRVHLIAPPTPRMRVYALDRVSGLWAFTETQAAEGEAAFTLVVPPGSYEIFAGAEGSPAIEVGYSIDGLALAPVAVAAGQTVADILVGPPGQSQCGAMMGYPASPDGRFAALPGPAADCLTSIPASNPVAVQPPTRIQFQPNAVSWQTSGELAPGASNFFVISAQKGQLLTVELTTNPDSGADPAATVSVWAGDGQDLTPPLTTKWQGTLPASQDYQIAVNSHAQQKLTYSLLVAIPALGSTPYVPVPLSICQTLQEMATQTLGVSFALDPNAPFQDWPTGEVGQGCTLTAKGTAANFTEPFQTINKLVNGFAGFTENPAYKAGGPTGAATAVTRDMALVLIEAKWAPAPEANCPANQPIGDCLLTPEQKLYTITIQAAMK